ncbi:MAG TPA: transglycosylase domain-containing protein [Treponemataceae bacterium]|nr:transglycosylase domain-containing protein [Treponemataceae bacterium]
MPLKNPLHRRPRRKPARPLTLRRVCTKVLVVVAVAHLSFMALTTATLIVYKFANPPVTSVMLYRKLFYGWKTRKVRYLPLAKIPKSVRNMVLRVEDGSFYSHHGIVPAAIKNAWQINREIGRPMYGGSTITMQTARTIFLVPEKSYLRKYLEVIVALEMEVVLGKKRIFELYMNYAEWGKGVFGVEAASVYHYGTSVYNLSTDQRIRLVTLLSSPIKYGPDSINRSGVLRSRYAYLTERFNAEPALAPAQAPIP